MPELPEEHIPENPYIPMPEIPEKVTRKHMDSLGVHRDGDEDFNNFENNLSDHAEDAEDDLLHVDVDAEKTWTTEEDKDLDRIERLAKNLRRADPLLPPPLLVYIFGKHIYIYIMYNHI